MGGRTVVKAVVRTEVALHPAPERARRRVSPVEAAGCARVLEAALVEELEHVGWADKDVVDENEVGRQRRVPPPLLGRQTGALKERRLRRRVVKDRLDRDVAVDGELLDPVDHPPVGLVRVRLD